MPLLLNSSVYRVYSMNFEAKCQRPAIRERERVHECACVCLVSLTLRTVDSFVTQRLLSTNPDIGQAGRRHGSGGSESDDALHAQETARHRLGARHPGAAAAGQAAARADRRGRDGAVHGEQSQSINAAADRARPGTDGRSADLFRQGN